MRIDQRKGQPAIRAGKRGLSSCPPNTRSLQGGRILASSCPTRKVVGIIIIPKKVEFTVLEETRAKMPYGTGCPTLNAMDVVYNEPPADYSCALLVLACLSCIIPAPKDGVRFSLHFTPLHDKERNRPSPELLDEIPTGVTLMDDFSSTARTW